MQTSGPPTNGEEASDAADQEAMLALQAGEDAALNHIMTRWELPLKSFLYRYTTNWSVAADLAQETFVKIYLNRHRYRPKGAFSSWLFSIASNLARNEARWRKRHPGSSLSNQPAASETREDPLASVEDGKPLPDDSADRNDRARLVRAALSQLPHNLKTPLLLFEYQGLSHREIGEALGCSEKAVETRLYRARMLMREVLEKSGVVLG